MRALGIVIVALLLPATRGLACPFCDAVSQPLAERIEIMDVALFVQLVEYGDPNEIDPETDDLMRSEFRVVKVVKGDQFNVGDTVKVVLFDEPVEDGYYFLTASTAPDTVWDLPLVVSERTFDYVDQVLALPQGPERLVFFLDYLQDEDEALRKDAYAEFAKMPYEGVIALKPKLDREQVRSWIESPEISVPDRRLYFTLLGICGNDDDAALLRQIIESGDAGERAGFDALIACYLSLVGEPGLAVIGDSVLDNPDAPFADVFSAIMALRFHGNEWDRIPRSALQTSMHKVLQRPEMADTVIPDLARWEDWSVIEDIKQLFLTATEDQHFIRVPALNYLRACPLPEAVAALEHLREMKPEEVKQAEEFGLFAEFTGPDRSGTSLAAEASESENRSTAPGLAERVRAMVEADQKKLNPYPGLWWGVPVALLVVIGTVFLLERVS